MRIGVDIDSVLANIMPLLVDYINKRGINIKLEDILSSQLDKFLGVSYNEAVGLVDEFFVEWFGRIQPINGSIQAITKLKMSGHELFIISARTLKVKKETILWLKKFYGKNTFSEMFFTDKFRNPNAPKKVEIMQENHFDVLIDDEPRNCVACSKQGIISILFNYNNSHNWAKMESDESNIIKTYSWEETLNKINSLVLIKNSY